MKQISKNQSECGTKICWGGVENPLDGGLLTSFKMGGRA